jgi:hypothetical protein
VEAEERRDEVVKIVINSCFGGFSLSPAAVKRLAELKGKECYFFKTDLSSQKKRGGFFTYTPATMEEVSSNPMWTAFDIPNPEEVLTSGRDWDEMSQEERAESNNLYFTHQLTSRPDNRIDPDLIRVVEELGEAANGSCAQLKVIEIPDGIEYFIDEYDGIETIREEHRSWD